MKVDSQMLECGTLTKEVASCPVPSSQTVCTRTTKQTQNFKNKLSNKQKAARRKPESTTADRPGAPVPTKTNPRRAQFPASMARKTVKNKMVAPKGARRSALGEAEDTLHSSSPPSCYCLRSALLLLLDCRYRACSHVTAMCPLFAQ